MGSAEPKLAKEIKIRTAFICSLFIHHRIIETQSQLQGRITGGKTISKAFAIIYFRKVFK
jgi:hypothetical protein